MKRFDTLDVAGTEGGGERELLGGQYKVLRKLGEGGMGVVYLAEDVELGREVAVKVLGPMLAGNKRAVENLRREARTAIKLNHRNIIRLYGFHVDGEMKYLVMEYIDGVTLEDKLLDAAGRKLEIDEVLRISEQIAVALDYAHGQESPVVHRDLKPSNIMIDKAGGVKVVDFGIAREMKDSYTMVTGKQDTSGTLPYMSPEQLRGQQVDKRMDVYSLAVMCYECLAGCVPFYTGDIQYQIVHEQPGRIEGVSDDVNAALQRGLAKEPSERIAGAGELVRAMGGEMIAGSAGRGVSKRDRASKVGKLVVAIVMLAAVGGGAFFGVDKYREYESARQVEEEAKREQEYEQGQEQERREEEQRRLDAERQTQREQVDKQIEELLSQGRMFKEQGLLNESLEKVAAALVLDGQSVSAKQLQSELSALITQQQSDAEREKSFNSYFDAGYVYESRGDWEKAIEAYSKALTVKVNNAEAADRLAGCQHNLYVKRVRESEAAQRSRIEREAELERVRRETAARKKAQAEAEKARREAQADEEKARRKAQVDEKRARKEAQAEADRVASYNRLVGNAKLAIEANDYEKAVKLYKQAMKIAEADDIASLGREVVKLEGQLAKKKLEDELAAEIELAKANAEGAIANMEYDVAFAILEGTLSKRGDWQWGKQQRAALLKRGFFAGGEPIAVGSVKTGEMLGFADNGKMVVSSGRGSITIWDLSGGRAKQIGSGAIKGNVKCAAIAGNGRLMACGTNKKVVALRKVAKGLPVVWELEGVKGGVNSVAVSRDGRYVGVAGGQGVSRVLDGANGKEVAVLSGHKQAVHCVAFSGDGGKVASGGQDKAVRIWDAVTGECLKVLNGHKKKVNCVEFSPDGRMVVSCSNDKTVKLWSVGSGKCLRTLSGHKGVVGSVAFSSDGKMVLSTRAKVLVRIWSVDSGLCVGDLRGEKSIMVGNARFSNGDKQIVSYGAGGSVMVWNWKQE